MIAATTLIVLTTLAAQLGSYGLIESIGGQVDSVAFTGNGNLSIGIDTKGAMSVCRWPGTTAPNQLTHNVQTRGPDAMWGVVLDNTIVWLSEAAEISRAHEQSIAPILVANYKAVGAKQTIFVHPEHDIAVVRIEFTGDPPVHVVWAANFSPCTSPMQGLPSSELFLRARRDMAAFVEEDVVYHARPEAPGSWEWEQTEEWAKGGHAPEWFERGEGVWIAYAPAHDSGGAVCGAESGDTSARALAEAGKWGSTRRAVGACASAVLVPVQQNAAMIVLAVGRKREVAEAMLQGARDIGLEALLGETQQWWDTRIQQMARPNAPDAVVALYERALCNLLLCADRESGAVARGLHATPPLAVDITRGGVWSSLALDLAQEPLRASKLLMLHAGAIRKSDAPGAPAGSLPVALYGSGEEAAPQHVLDVCATSWWLWAVWQHDGLLPESERDEYRAEVARAVALAGDFLAHWSRATRDTPVFSFAPERLSDSANLETIAAVYAGLRAASLFSQAVGKERADWAARCLELEDYLRFHALNAAGNFKIENPVSLWATQLLPAGDPRWDAAVAVQIEGINTQDGPESLKTLANMAMVLRDQKDKLATLQPYAGPVIQAVLDAYPCDSYYSALAVVTIMTLYGP